MYSAYKYCHVCKLSIIVANLLKLLVANYYGFVCLFTYHLTMYKLFNILM